MDDIEHIQINIADYQPHPRNYNEHPDPQVGEIAESLRLFGQVKPVVVWRDWYIAGHGVVLGAQRLGWTQLKAERLPADWPEYKALAYLAADNELARGASPNLTALAALAKEVQAEDAGMGRLAAGGEEGLRRLAALMGEPAGEDAGPQIDRAEELREKWGVELGQMWQLGEHRVICGDCTDAGVVARLGKVDALFTDPPYGIGVDTAWLTALNVKRGKPGNMSDDKLQGDDGSLDLSFLWRYGRRIVWGFPYIFDPQATGWIVWDKQPGIESRGIVTPIEMASTTMRKGFDVVRVMWGGYYRAAGEDRQPHPTQKPVGVVAPFVEAWTKPGEAVFDPFLGSGTTMVAAHRLGRRCFGIEVDPGYCAVALERMSAMGITPVLVED